MDNILFVITIIIATRVVYGDTCHADYWLCSIYKQKEMSEILLFLVICQKQQNKNAIESEYNTHIRV